MPNDIVEHIATMGGDGMVDQVTCSCGWEGNPFFDGAEYAMNEWQRHKDASPNCNTSQTEKGDR